MTTEQLANIVYDAIAKHSENIKGLADATLVAPMPHGGPDDYGIELTINDQIFMLALEETTDLQ